MISMRVSTYFTSITRYHTTNSLKCPMTVYYISSNRVDINDQDFSVFFTSFYFKNTKYICVLNSAFNF